MHKRANFFFIVVISVTTPELRMKTMIVWGYKSAKG